MELPDKSRAYSELIVDSLRIKNNIINDFVNGPTLTYTGHYDVFRLIDIDAFTVTVTLPERYDKVEVELVPLSGSIPDDPFVSIDSVTGPAILKKVRNVTVVSPTSITFTTIDGDHFWVTAYGRNSRGEADQWTCEVHPKIVPPNDHGVYSSALTSLMCGTVVMKSTTHDDAVAMARSRPGALIIASATSSTVTVTLSQAVVTSAVNCQPFMFDGKVLVGGEGADYLIDATQTPPSYDRNSFGSPSVGPVPFPLSADCIVDLKGGYEDYSRLNDGFYARRGFNSIGGEYTCQFSGDWDVLEGSAFVQPKQGKLWVITWTKGLMLLNYDDLPTDPSTPTPITQTPNDAIAGYASGHVIAAFDRYVFATATGRAPSGDNIIRIDMNDQSVTTLHEEQVGRRVLMDGDACYGVMNDEGNVGYKVFRCSGDGSFTVGDRIPYGYITVMIATDAKHLLFAYANDAGQGTVSWLDRSTLKLTPATDVSMPEGWQTKWKSADAIVATDTRTITGRCEMFECTTANGPERIYFMVANADGDIDEISIPTAATTAATMVGERCVPQRQPSTSPLSTSLRSRYGR